MVYLLQSNLLTVVAHLREIHYTLKLKVQLIFKGSLY